MFLNSRVSRSTQHEILMRIYNKFGHIVKQMAIFYEPIPYWVTSFIEAPLEEEDTDSKTNRYLDKHIAESCWTFVLVAVSFRQTLG